MLILSNRKICAGYRKILLATAVTLGFSPELMAGDVYVPRLGASTGWYSDDTRSATGASLFGLNLTVPGPATGTAGYSEDGDLAIAQQIKFGDFYSGSEHGVMSLDGTSANTGKSSVKRYGLEVSASELADFVAVYRWYMDPYPTSRTPALGLIVVGSDGKSYSMPYVGSGSIPGWNEFTVDASVVGWRIYGNGAPGGAMSPVSMTTLLADPTYGSLISGGTVVAVGFNIGSSQRQCRVGIDWMQCSLLEGGNRIQFVEDLDSDDDGLLDANEKDIGTDETNPDTDGDGVSDGIEVNSVYSDPLDSDTDDDTLSDGEEVELGTSPNDADTDGDGFDDPLEVLEFISDPLDPSDPLDIGNGTVDEALGLEAAGIGADILTLDRDLFIDSTGNTTQSAQLSVAKLSLVKNTKAAEGRRTSLSNRLSDASKALVQGDYLAARMSIYSALAKVDDSVSGEPDWIRPSDGKDAVYDSLLGLLQLIDYFER